MGNGFLNRIFGKFAKHDQPGSPELQELQETLRTQYGIQVDEDNRSVPDLLASGYRPVRGEEIARINAIFQYVPQLVAGQLIMQNAQQAVSGALQGSYHVRLSPTTNEMMTRSASSAIRTASMQPGAANTELPADAPLQVSSAPQIALGVFTATSFITGQYFLAQINKKLASISAGVGRIEQYLQAAERSKLTAAAQEMQDVVSRLNYIEKDQARLEGAMDQIHVIQRQCQESINLNRELALAEAAAADRKDAAKEISRRLSAIGTQMIQYHYAVETYTAATLIEIRLSRVIDPADLETFRTQMLARVDQYKADLANCHQAIDRYLDESSLLNDSKWWESALSASAGSITQLFAKTFARKQDEIVGNAVDEFFAEKRQQKKEAFLAAAQAVTAPLADLKAIEDPVRSVTLCIDAFRKEIDFVQVGNDYYTNLPDLDAQAEAIA